jgi:hypothetical protein
VGWQTKKPNRWPENLLRLSAKEYAGPVSTLHTGLMMLWRFNDAVACCAAQALPHFDPPRFTDLDDEDRQGSEFAYMAS